MGNRRAPISGVQDDPPRKQSPAQRPGSPSRAARLTLDEEVTLRRRPSPERETQDTLCLLPGPPLRQALGNENTVTLAKAFLVKHVCKYAHASAPPKSCLRENAFSVPLTRWLVQGEAAGLGPFLRLIASRCSSRRGRRLDGALPQGLASSPRPCLRPVTCSVCGWAPTTVRPPPGDRTERTSLSVTARSPASLLLQDAFCRG